MTNPSSEPPPLQQRSFGLSSSKQLVPCEGAVCEASDLLLTLVHGEDEAELKTILADQSIPHGAIEACVEPHPATRISVYEDWLLITMPVSRTWDDRQRNSVSFLVEREKLIVLHRQKQPVFDDFVCKYSEGLRFHGATLSAVLYQMLDFIVDEDMAFTLRSREELVRIEELAEINGIEFASDSANLKRCLSSLSATIEDQLYCLRSLQTIETNAVSIDDIRHFLHDTIADIEHAARNIERQESRLNAAHQEVQIRQQSRTNDQLRILTILSTIFLPLTLITGIYGMNFVNMPELGWRYGYVDVLILMVLMTGAMLWGFQRANWFR